MIFFIWIIFSSPVDAHIHQWTSSLFSVGDICTLFGASLIIETNADCLHILNWAFKNKHLLNLRENAINLFQKDGTEIVHLKNTIFFGPIYFKWMCLNVK